MLITTILFYVFAGMTITSALAVISARNPVYSVLWLILCFFNAAGLMVMTGAEFLAMLLVIVYVGAVAVLFLFVVMMLNINLARLKEGFLKYLPLGLLVAAVMFLELLGVLYSSTIDLQPAAVAATAAPVSNTAQIGLVLYTDYLYLFQLAGVILLVAMIGAIVLTHRTRVVRRQNIYEQVFRDPRDSVRLVKVEVGKGVGG